MNGVKVSLILAIYNGEKYLNQCLKSIISQTYKDFEVILVDDGSTDTSGKICDEYARIDSRITVIHKNNGGCSSARNLGLKIAKGEYIGIVDQDDSISSDYLSYFMGLIEKYDVQIATSLYIQNFIGDPSKIKIDTKDDVIFWNGIYAAEAMLMYVLQIGPWNKLIKKSIIDDNNISFREDIYCGEGFAFSIECFQAASKVAVGKRKVYYYRIDNVNSGSSTFSPFKFNSSLRAQEYMACKLVDKSDFAKKVLDFSFWKTISDYYTLLKVSGCEKQFITEFNYLKKNIRKNAFKAFVIPTTFKQKVRALMFIISPKIAVYLLNKKVKHTTGNKYKK